MYKLQLIEHTFSAQCPEYVLLLLILFRQFPSLHFLPPNFLWFVRKLLWYYETVRLPAIVHQCCTPFGFSTRTLNILVVKVNCRISRFPRIKFLYMCRVSDHVES